MLYRAIRIQDGLPVLLKVPASPHPSSVLLHRLEHEYQLARGLDSSLVSRAIALERYAGTAALVMEPGPSKSLASMLGLPLDIHTFLWLAIGISNALAEIHCHGLVHKDIKPEHVLLGEEGQVWLTGLGIASRLPREPQAPELPEVIVGTLAYMSPEQTGRMNRSIDSRSDLYTLGITFYQMLTGTLPFTADDPIEWVHCHIARQPPAPIEQVTGIPETLSEIVMKLLAKSAEERYQSVDGLNADLRRCQSEWESNARIERFPLAEHDMSERLLIPERLYGRRSETDTLLAAFARVASTGTSEVVLVSGGAGSGKTSVVYELHKALVPLRGMFALGKFDQYKRDIPYAPLVQATQTIVRHILGKDEREVAEWRYLLQQAVGKNGQLIVDLIPEVALIIGEQPPVPELPAQEAQNRFQRVLRGFLRSFSGPEHPMIFFLDDLQWLDSATLGLLKLIAQGLEGNYLLLIGAYRDNEVAPTHPLMQIIEHMRKNVTGMHEIVLNPLSCDDEVELIADSLHCDRESVLPLAQLLHEKTGGNPFFVIQFLTALYDERLLVFDPGINQWVWDTAKIHAKGYTDNVVDLMVEKIGRLPSVTLAVLEQFACLGNSAEITTLSMIYGQSEEELHAVLWEAVRAGLILRLEDAYTFSHDRVQEAAYALVPERRKKELHLKIGRLLLAQYSQELMDEHLFEIVEQFDRSVELVTEIEERQTLLRLNIAAGRKARAAAAYVSARRYLEQAKALLPSAAWQLLYSESAAVFLELAEAEYLSGNFPRAGELLTEALAQQLTVPDKILGYRMRLRLYQLSGRFNDAMSAAIEVLRLFEITFPESDADIRAATELEIQQISDNLGGRSIADLVDAPLAQDADMQALIGLLAEAMPLIYVVRPLLWPLLTAKGVNLCLQYGHTAESPFVYSCYAMVAVAICADIPSAIQFSEMAMKLNERLPVAAAWRGKLLFHHGAVVNIWGRHFAENLPLLDEAFQASIDAGDLANAGYLTYNSIWLHLENGDPLDLVVERAGNYADFARQNHNEVVYQVDRMEEQFALSLQGKTRSLTDFSAADFDEDACFAAIEQAGFGLGVAYHHIMKQMAAFLAEQYDEALEWANRTTPILLQVAAMANEVTHHFYHALTLAALLRQAPPEQQSEYKRRLGDILEKLRYWAENCPGNFSNRYALISAELARIEGRDLAAMRLYDQAKVSAHANGFVQQEALAAELASRFYQERGFDRIAIAYLRDARTCYANWGAQGKVRQMELSYPQLRKTATVTSTSTFLTGTQELDIQAIIQASQAISSEILLDNLLKTMMRIVLEVAGAQHGYLLLKRNNELTLAAAAHVENQTIITQVQGESDFSQVELPASIINYVHHSLDQLLLDDASATSPYAADAYFAQQHPKSLLCFPITKQAILVGLLYLENNLVTYAFTPDRLAVLKLVSAQAAISLENAIVYEASQENEAKYRRIVDTAAEGILVLGADATTSFVNTRAVEMFCYSAEELLGRRLTDLMFAEDVPGTLQQMEQGLKQRLQASEWRFRRNDGQILWALVSITPTFDSNNNLISAIAMLTDITERKLMEDALLFVAQRGWQVGADTFFNYLAQFLGETFDMDYVIIDKLDDNPDIAETVALYAKGSIVPNMRYALKGTPCENVMGQQLCVYQQSVQQQFPEDTLLVEMGVEGYLGTPLWDFSGRPIGLIAMMSSKPISDYALAAQVLQLVATRAAAELERARSDRILRKREHEFRTLAESLPDNIVRYDLEGRAIYINPVLAKNLGVPPEDRLGKRVREFHTDASFDAYAEAVDAALASGKDSEFDIALPVQGQKDSIVQLRVLAERDEHGAVTGALAIGRDITMRKQAEEMLYRLNRELRAISACNQALVRSEDEQVLLGDICRIVCEEAGYRMAWVGYAEHDGNKTIRPIAWAGVADGYLTDTQLTWAEMEQGNSPCGCAVRNGTCFCIQDFTTEPQTSPWRAAALQHGYRSSISLPLKDEGANTFGVFNIFSTIANAFTPEEVRMLEELAGDMAFGIMSLRARVERYKAEQRLRESEEKYAVAFRASPNLIVLTRMSDGAIVEVNEGYSQLLGYSRDESLGKTTESLSIWANESDRAVFVYSLERNGQVTDFETTLRRKDGEVITVIDSARTITIQGEMYVLSVAHDISERKAAEKEIERLAFQDSLTKLPNRRLLLDRLHQALASVTRSRRRGALLFIDLDNFKILNDTLGHDAGDQLLVEVARRLATCVREGDTISRFGGDEFMLMLNDLGENNLETVAQIKVVGEKIMATLNRPYMIYGVEHHSTPSIGVTLFFGGDNSVDELMKQADIAMYQAKSEGRNRLRFFDPEMQAALSERAALETSLRQAIEEGQFILLYQPQVESVRGVVGAEALLRWNHPELGMVCPGQFIPLAEETGLIRPIGQWVLQTACNQLKAWANDPRTSELQLAVNVSARQFRQEDFVDQMRLVLEETQAPAIRLKIELTESLLLDDIEGAIEKMQVIKQLGVGFALDDFGTGYSSMSYLTRLPLTQLKIDQSFIYNLPDSQNDAVIAQTIITMAKSLNLSVIAEGVETEAQREFLEQHGCSTFQGYLFSRPVMLENFEALLASSLSGS